MLGKLSQGVLRTQVGVVEGHVYMGGAWMCVLFVTHNVLKEW